METFPEDPFETVKARIVSSLYVLMTLTHGLDDALVNPHCPSSIFVCFLPFKVFLIIHKKMNILIKMSPRRISKFTARCSFFKTG